MNRQEDESPSRGRPSVIPKVKTALHQWIAREGMVGGDRLPSELELSRQFGIARMTLRRVVDELVDDGLLERQSGSGTFVKQRAWTTVGLAVDFSVLHRQTSFFLRWLVDHTRRLLDERGYATHLMPFNIAQNRFEDDAINALRHQPVSAALLVSGCAKVGAIQRLRAASIPHVCLLGQQTDDNEQLIVTTSTPIARGVQTLVAQGRTRIGLFGIGFQRRTDERDLATATAQICGAVVEDHWIITGNESEIDAVARGRNMADAWSMLAERPDAVLFVDHFEAQGFINRRLAQTGDFKSLPTIAIIEACETPLDLPCPVWRIRFAVSPVITRSVNMIADLVEGRRPRVGLVQMDCPLTIECSAHATGTPSAAALAAQEVALC